MSDDPVHRDLIAPPKWQEDALSHFFEAAHRNQWATFARKPEQFALLSKLDACFEKVANGLINPQNKLAALMFLRCHAYYRSACQNAVAGQVVETFVMIRACLECAGYSLHMSKASGADLIWLSRHDGDAEMKAAKDVFKVAKVRATISSCNRKAGEVFDLLYQTSIDLGAHPNERAVTGSMDIVECGDRVEMRQIYMHGDGIQLDYALKSAARAGVCALEILQEVFAARFEILGVRSELLTLRAGL